MSGIVDLPINRCKSLIYRDESKPTLFFIHLYMFSKIPQYEEEIPQQRWHIILR